MTPSKRYAILILCLAGIAYGLFPQLNAPEAEPTKNALLESKVQPPTSSPISMKETVRAPVQLPQAQTGLVEKASQNGEPDCMNQIRQSVALDFDRFQELVHSRIEPLLSTCGASTPPSLSMLAKHLEDQCIGKSNLSAQAQITCEQTLQGYRALLIDLASQDHVQLSELSSSVLLNKSIAVFYNHDWSKPEHHARLTADVDRLADELLRRGETPNYAMKMKIAARANSRSSPELERLAATALEAFPQDSELLDAKFYSKLLTQSEREFQGSIERYVKANPENAVGHYWLAGIHWKNGDITKSKKALARALHLDPNNHRFQRTSELATSEAAGAGSQVFYFNFVPPIE